MNILQTITSNALLKWLISSALIFITLAIGKYVWATDIKIVPLELASTPAKANEVMKTFNKDDAIESIRRDWYFIIAYVVTFVFCVFLARDVFAENTTSAPYLFGTMLIIASIFAGAFDAVENFAMLKMWFFRISR
jgi:hypothetical protein